MRTQPRMESGPGDIYEQEADRAADQVLKAPQRLTQHQIQQQKPIDDEHASRIRQSADRSLSPLNTMASTEVPPIVHEALSSSCQPLDSTTREFFEPRFNRDFSQVRVHVSPPAAESAEAIGAAAYTVGQDIVFGVGRFNPQSHEGRRLIAHELTHTVQQGRGGHTPPLDRDAPHERHADDVAKAVADGRIVAAVPGSTAVGIARDTPWGKPIASEFDDELMLMLADMRWRDPESLLPF
jgi:Domain of unknown function (DUF4157)